MALAEMYNRILSGNSAAVEKTMMPLYATFDGQVLRPDEPIFLPPNTRVRLLLEPAAESDSAAGEAHAFLSVARSLHLEGPPDWSARLRIYLYGDDEGI
jgi:hypothetical protein